MKFEHFKGKVFTYICDATDLDNQTNEHGQRVICSDDDGKVWSIKKLSFYGYVQNPSNPTGIKIRRYREMRCPVCGEWVDECRAGHKPVKKEEPNQCS